MAVHIIKANFQIVDGQHLTRVAL